MSMRILVAVIALLAAPAVTCAEPLSPQDVQDYFDRAWSETLSEEGVVPGAVVTVVQGDRVLLNKGYGLSDSATGAPVDPDRTRVRIGSTSKLFTALTALALVDAGQLDLDTDVNEYLTIARVPDTYAEPVTLRTLLSHLSGFDSEISGFGVYDNEDIGIDPAEYQRRLVRVRPPGREYGYDNLGLGLLGQVAAEASHTTFAAAVEQRVLQPLQMPNTAMGVPDRQLAELGACHSWDDNGDPAPCQHKFMRAVFQGAGDISTTGADMARFMQAMLDGGCLDGRCLLQPQTWAQFTDMGMNRLHPRAKGMGFVLYEKSIAGHFAIGHDGGQDGFSTTLTLLPEQGIGIFISQFAYMGIPAGWGLSYLLDMFSRGALHNTYANANKVIDDFAERLLPAPSPRPAAQADAVPLAALEGNYLGTRAVGTSLLNRVARSAGAVKVEVEGDAVTIAGKGPYRQTEPGVLTAGNEEVAWYPTLRGKDVFLQSGAGTAVDMLVRQPWHTNAQWTVLPLLLPVLMALVGAIFSFIRRNEPSSRRLGRLLAFTGTALLLGLYLELEYFAPAYYPEGGSLALVGWRILLNLAWLSAGYSLYLIVARRGELLAFSGVAAAGRSLLVGLFVLSSLIVLVLLPYWGLIGNFNGPP